MVAFMLVRTSMEVILLTTKNVMYRYVMFFFLKLPVELWYMELSMDKVTDRTEEE